MTKREELWQDLYQHEADVFAFIKNAVGDADVARDLFQDVFLSALKNLSSLDTERSLKNWLYTITRNRVINYFRYHQRREFNELDEKDLQVRMNQFEDSDLQKEALTGLPARQKQVLLLREIEGFSYEEIARQMEMSESAVTALLSRARENFQKIYLAKFLPDWLAEIARQIEISDIFRFVNPFNPPLDVIRLIDRKREKYFSNITAGWDQIRSQFFTARDLAKIMTNFDLTTGQRAADLGCGTGFVSVPLALSGISVTAVDADRGMMAALDKVCTEIGLENINLLQADLRQLPMKKQSFDYLFAVLVMHHLPDPFKFLENCRNLLKKDGRLVLVDFVRHRERQLADQMHDMWLGFQPDGLIKRLRKDGWLLEISEILTEEKKIPTFYQVYVKM